jgi:hypothetical protein
MEKQHLEMLQLLESIEVMLKNGDSIHPNSVIRGAIQTAIGMEIDVTNVKDKCDNKSVTAVEWLEEALVSIDNIDNLIEQAKEMENEQREQAFVEGYKARALASNLIFDEASKLYAQQLFKETFKSE